MAALKIQYKLFAAMFAWSAVLIFVLAVSIQDSLDSGMIDYVNQKELESLAPLIEELGEGWLETESWAPFEEQTGKFRRLLNHHLRENALLPERRFAREGNFMPPPHGEGRPRGGGPQRRPPPPRRDGSPPPDPPQLFPQDRPPEGSTGPNDVGAPRPFPLVSYVLLDKNKELVAGVYPPDREYSFVEIKPLKEAEGYLAVSKRSFLADGYELKFLDQQQEKLVVIGSILLIVTFLLTLPFAQHLVKPIRTIAHSLSKLSKGDYQATLSTKRRDEFRLLYQNINNLAKTLAENQSARQKWFADIAHDLRTPIAIMRGELEAMLDGVRKLDVEQVESIHSETLRLQRFIHDLHELARSELGTQHYQKSNINLCEFLEGVCQHCEQMLAKHDIKISCELPDTEQYYLADEFRLAQCLDNILSNIANYAHNATTARVTLSTDGNNLRMMVEDDGIGVEEQHLSKLFDHLYRVEGSRNRTNGGSGLGLAICRNIIEAHDGNICAEKSVLGGLAIIISLPLK